MSKKLGLLTIIWLLILSTGPLGADDGFYVIGGGGAGVGTRITSVPFTINNSGLYYLGRNLEYNGTSTAITIAADYVTLDLMGRSLTYSGAGADTTGIFMVGCTHVEIRNGIVKGFSRGVYESSLNGANHRVCNIRATYNTDTGILLYGKNHLVKGCTSCNNTFNGIFIDSGAIIGSVAGDNDQYGMVLRGPGSLLDNVANNNTSSGFVIHLDANILVDGNSAAGNDINYLLGGPNTKWGLNAGR